MLMTFSEFEVPISEASVQGVAAWLGAVAIGLEPLLILRILRGRGNGNVEARTVLATAKGLSAVLGSALPATVVAAYAVRFEYDSQLSRFPIDQFWLPARNEGRDGVLVRVAGEATLRDGTLQQLPDMEGRTLYVEVTQMHWLAEAPAA